MSSVFNTCYLLGSFALTCFVLLQGAPNLLPYAVGCLTGFVVHRSLTPSHQ